MVQEIYSSESEAVARAEELSKKHDYVCVVQNLQTNIFYVELEPPFIRNFEKLVKEYSVLKKECEHDWQYNYDCFEDARIFELDTLGIPVKCSKCNKEGVEWWAFSEVTEK